MTVPENVLGLFHWVPDISPAGLLFLKATLWMAAAWWAHFLLRNRHPRLRVVLWRVCAAGVVALPVIAAWSPSLDVAIPRRPSELPVTSPRHDDLGLLPSNAQQSHQTATLEPTRSFGGGVRADEARVGWHVLLAAVWLAGIVILTARFAVGLIRVRALVRRARPAPAWIEERRRDLCGVLPRCASVRVGVSDEIRGPLLVGVLRPTILIPASLVDASCGTAVAAMLAHEIGHVRTHDLAWGILVRGVATALWWHPLAWWINAAHDAACEEECDAGAAQSAGGVPEYTRVLAQLALEVHRPIAAAVPMIRGPEVLRRIDALECGRARVRLPKGRALKLAACGGAIVLAVAGLSCSRRGPKGLYETAPASRGMSIQVGPTLFEVDGVARWDRQGRVRIEDGAGKSAPLGRRVRDYSAQAPWMDIANVYVLPGPDRYDLLELRVFDHETQESLWDAGYPAAGYELMGDVVQLRSLGRPLPGKVDVWMRVMHRPPDSPIWRIEPQPGTAVELDKTTLSLREMRAGTSSYSLTGVGKFRWTSPGKDPRDRFMGVFEWPGRPTVPRNAPKYQICAVGKNGERSVPDYPHFFGEISGSIEVATFFMPLEQLDHFEAQPFHGRDRFYFEGVALPRVDPLPLKRPPPIVVPVNGEEVRHVVEAYAPATVEVSLFRGTPYAGVASNGTRAWAEEKPEPVADADTRTTVRLQTRGLSLREGGTALVPEVYAADGARPTARSYGRGSSPVERVAWWIVDVPVQSIERVEFDLGTMVEDAE